MLTSKEWTSFSKLRLCVIEILQNNKLLIIHFFKWVHFIQLWSLASHSSGLTTCFSRHTSRRAPNSCFQRADNSLPTKSQMQSIHSSCSQQVQLLRNLNIYSNLQLSLKLYFWQTIFNKNLYIKQIQFFTYVVNGCIKEWSTNLTWK